MRFPMIPRWTSYIASKPQRVAQKRSVQNLNSKAAISPNRYERGCQLLIINGKSHMGFRLILTSMTLNDLEGRDRQIAIILHLFNELDSFPGQLRHSGWR